MMASANARSRGESSGKPCSGSRAMASGSSRREESTSCANGQKLLQLDSSPSSHACSNTLPTGHRPIDARVIAALRSDSTEAMDAHNVLSVRHWDRIGRGLLYAATSAVPWAILHARTDTRMENAELRMENAEMQSAECRNCNGETRQWRGGAWSAVGAAGRRVVGGLGVIWGENAGGLVRPGGGNVWGIARVEGVALFG